MSLGLGPGVDITNREIDLQKKNTPAQASSLGQELLFPVGVFHYRSGISLINFVVLLLSLILDRAMEQYFIIITMI